VEACPRERWDGDGKGFCYVGVNPPPRYATRTVELQRANSNGGKPNLIGDAIPEDMSLPNDGTNL